MTSLLETTAKGTTGFVVVKEAGTSLISAIGNVAVSSARSAEFGSNETEGTDGIVSVSGLQCLHCKFSTFIYRSYCGQKHNCK